jgi:hypothetical protein
VKLSEFRRACADEFGDDYSGVLIRDHWLAALAGTPGRRCASTSMFRSSGATAAVCSSPATEGRSPGSEARSRSRRRAAQGRRAAANRNWSRHARPSCKRGSVCAWRESAAHGGESQLVATRDSLRFEYVFESW